MGKYSSQYRKCYIMADIVQNAMHQHNIIIPARAHSDGTAAQSPWGLHAEKPEYKDPRHYNTQQPPMIQDDDAYEAFMCLCTSE